MGLEYRTHLLFNGWMHSDLKWHSDFEGLAKWQPFWPEPLEIQTKWWPFFWIMKGSVLEWSEPLQNQTIHNPNLKTLCFGNGFRI